MSTTMLKSIRVSKETRERIKQKQKKGESVIVLVERLLNQYEGLL